MTDATASLDNKADGTNSINSPETSENQDDPQVAVRLVIAASLMLFLELALIRWLGSNVLHLSYFSNFVLLGSFLGIGAGFLISRKKWSCWPYSLPRLTRDATYNATLGAAHLGELFSDLRGSYILTFAGYNAGAGRAVRWVKAYGDPRGGKTDPIDWIERIPFDETRDYVQKVMENLQAYKSRLGYPLSISADLQRGRPVD